MTAREPASLEVSVPSEAVSLYAPNASASLQEFGGLLQRAFIGLLLSECHDCNFPRFTSVTIAMHLMLRTDLNSLVH
ncbi:hypothetical protein [Rhizobium lusitanum]|uniref:Uncharacterized protein n=1 Tax=Rhizobium lusitanum TaxID=293958 RepID=A0A7X0IWM8_9HYPH|nr:hypothetical protein [Rhizobium lusitanum]MBB6487081.1 hypothetical protein [Rhizobium lusitanum]